MDDKVVIVSDESMGRTEYASGGIGIADLLADPVDIERYTGKRNPGYRYRRTDPVKSLRLGGHWLPSSCGRYFFFRSFEKVEL